MLIAIEVGAAAGEDESFTLDSSFLGWVLCLPRKGRWHFQEALLAVFGTSSVISILQESTLSIMGRFSIRCFCLGRARHNSYRHTFGRLQ